ncbi:maleylpyruvate isomerase family mycothiol-dependent enzyme [Nocardia jinanensis]|uniref:Maleylpyruvate isomerase n=1 Tax=Nocardia jinanensis TaxID=382504 RepID=A0A917VY75_9NOCA|nr:maleylpyruvate isomerase family mycothiol-dependent enzyme [Nocardia jinanensis]GGL37805.1 maleylpyruvate isomerase [Nocardia jinanensis]
MPSDFIELLTARMQAVNDATRELLATVDTLDEAAVAAASPLPGWTRGHVLTHLSRNADSLVNLLLWAHTGVETPQYASAALRDSDIEAGAPRPLAEQRADLAESADRLSGMAGLLTADQWRTEVRTRQGTPVEATRIPWMRLQEVLIHHVDLGAGYTPAQWPADFVAELLAEAAVDLGGRPGVRPFGIDATDSGFTAIIGAGEPEQVVAGPASALLAWLLGRGTGEALPRPLPDLPAWR